MAGKILLFQKYTDSKLLELFKQKAIVRKMSLRREVAIQRRQAKSRMTGQAFNPSGITGEEIRERERLFIEAMRSKSIEERRAYWEKVEKIVQEREDEGCYCSWEWEWCAFERHKYELLELGY